MASYTGLETMSEDLGTVKQTVNTGWWTTWQGSSGGYTKVRVYGTLSRKDKTNTITINPNNTEVDFRTEDPSGVSASYWRKGYEEIPTGQNAQVSSNNLWGPNEQSFSVITRKRVMKFSSKNWTQANFNTSISVRAGQWNPNNNSQVDCSNYTMQLGEVAATRPSFTIDLSLTDYGFKITPTSHTRGKFGVIKKMWCKIYAKDGSHQAVDANLFNDSSNEDIDITVYDHNTGTLHPNTVYVVEKRMTTSVGSDLLIGYEEIRTGVWGIPAYSRIESNSRGISCILWSHEDFNANIEVKLLGAAGQAYNNEVDELYYIPKEDLTPAPNGHISYIFDDAHSPNQTKIIYNASNYLIMARLLNDDGIPSPDGWVTTPLINMAGIYVSVNYSGEKLQTIYGSVDGKTKKLQKVYCSINGLSKLIYVDKDLNELV